MKELEKIKKNKKKEGGGEIDPSIFVWSASSSLILLKFKSQEENATLIICGLRNGKTIIFE